MAASLNILVVTFAAALLGKLRPKPPQYAEMRMDHFSLLMRRIPCIEMMVISSADYGREAIDTLVAEMENHRSDLVVIMAGYPNEMEKLMSGNIGLKSRMPYLIEFPNYTRGQLADIFLTMVCKGFHYNDDFSEAVKAYFESFSDEVIGAKDLSNARFVRNLF